MVRTWGTILALLATYGLLLNVQWQNYSAFGYDSLTDFETKYEGNLDDFSPVGEELFQARWLSDEEEEARDCVQYDFCSFMEVITLEECINSMEIHYALIGKNEQVIKTLTTVTSAPHPGEKHVVEIGASAKYDFEFFRPDDIKCSDLPIVG